MWQIWLNLLALSSMGYALAPTINSDDAITEFTVLKAR